ncbi:MAG: SusD/RagB family nutrient-binding outer membrane lipoprotein [Mangrovibacterium sp.]
MKKHIKYLASAAVLVGVLASCSEDRLDEINVDPNHPTNVSSEYIIPDVLMSTGFNVVGADLNFYSMVYTELQVGVYNQMYNAEIRTTEPQSSSTYNNQWGSLYKNLYNLKVIIEKCSEGGNEAGNNVTLGIAQIMNAYNLALLTDLFGDVPYSEALQPGVIFTPKLDKQEDLYPQIMQNLTDGIANIEAGSGFPSLGIQDFYYGGDADSWVRLANGLLARYTLRLSNVSPDYDAVLAYVDKSFTDASEECTLKFNGTSTHNPIYTFFEDRDYFGASQSLKDKLTALSDPRADKYWIAYSGNASDELSFAANGAPLQQQGAYSISNIMGDTNPIYIMSYHELLFVKAEAAARNGDLTTAKSALKEAIVAAMGKSNVAIKSETAEAYYTAQVEPQMTDQAGAIKAISLQKYIASYEEEGIEAYNDIRRWKAMGENNIELANPKNASGKFPLRFTYGGDDVTTNINISEAYGDGSYVYSENVWWAGGTR